jgi:protein gp37
MTPAPREGAVMSDRTGIEWTGTREPNGEMRPGATWNPMTGCTEVSAGCDHCYAATLARSERMKPIYGKMLPVVDTPANREDTFAPRFWPDRLDQPIRWKRPRKIFVNSMSDVFHAHAAAHLPHPHEAAGAGVAVCRPAAVALEPLDGDDGRGRPGDAPC